MKKLLRRLRLWLIRKLGGVMPRDVMPVVVREQQRPVRTVQARMNMSMLDLIYRSEENSFQYIMRRLADELAEKLISEDLIRFDYTDEKIYNERVYTATLTVVDPEPGAVLPW